MATSYVCVCVCVCVFSGKVSNLYWLSIVCKGPCGFPQALHTKSGTVLVYYREKMIT